MHRNPTAVVAAAALAAIAAIAACQPADQSAAAADEVRAADIAWSKTFAARDADQFVGYADSAVRLLAPNTGLVTGPADFRKVIETFFALPAFAGSWDVVVAEASRSGDLAYTSGTYRLTWQDSTGAAVNDVGKYATVWKKQADGSWKAVLDMFNSDLPPQ